MASASAQFAVIRVAAMQGAEPALWLVASSVAPHADGAVMVANEQLIAVFGIAHGSHACTQGLLTGKVGTARAIDGWDGLDAF